MIADEKEYSKGYTDNYNRRRKHLQIDTDIRTFDKKIINIRSY